MTTSRAGTAFEARGCRALARLGGRLTLVYGFATALGLLAAAGSAAAVVAGETVVLAAVAARAIGWAGMLMPARHGRHAADLGTWVPRSPRVRRAVPVLLVGVAVACAALTLERVCGLAPVLGWDRVHAVAGWVLPGVGLGLALATGPVWGLLSLAVLAVVFRALVAPTALDGVTGTLVGAAVTVVVGAAVHLAARTGFRVTELASRAAEDADLARLGAQRQLGDRRRTDRLLHDTVLATLTLLAHAAVGVPVAEVRAACRRDLALLNGTVPAPDAGPPDHGEIAPVLPAGPWPAVPSPAGPSSAVPTRRDGGAQEAVVVTARSNGTAANGVGAVARPRRRGAADATTVDLTGAGAGAGADAAPATGALSTCLHEVRRLAVRLGIELRVHLQSDSVAEVLAANRAPADPRLLKAWSGAVAECVTNIARHAQVGGADVVLGLSGEALVTVVVDEGVGFDPAAVSGERLGLVGSVQERVAEVGGQARIWSRPGQGTVVELLLPWSRRQEVAGVPVQPGADRAGRGRPAASDGGAVLDRPAVHGSWERDALHLATPVVRDPVVPAGLGAAAEPRLVVEPTLVVEPKPAVDPTVVVREVRR